MNEIKLIGLKEFNDAIVRNPQMVLRESKNFLVRGLAVYKAGIIRNPWRVGGSGGGSPVSNDPRYMRQYQRQKSGTLRDSHRTNVQNFVGKIGPDINVAPYARRVYWGEGNLVGRPWLEYVQESKSAEIEKLYQQMWSTITSDLAK